VDSIKQAIELAQAAEKAPHMREPAGPATGSPVNHAPDTQPADVSLDAKHLEANRIVAHGAASRYSRAYDMLRTQVLQEMDRKNWQFLAVTSPTANCGKTVTACNLAMSIARLPTRSALLVDLDLRKPTVAKYLGLKEQGGVLGVLDGSTALSSALVNARVDSCKLNVLPGSATPTGYSEWMSSQTMAMLLEAIKRSFRSCTIIVDLPPMLVGDDVISILPRMDAVLLVTGVGNTSLSDIKECQKHLRRTPVVRLVTNKITERTESYYGY
jgi:protein-tyrosine kinase